MDKGKEKTMNKGVIITRKIRLFIDIPKENKEELKKLYRRLYDWQSIAFKVSNIIVSHLYFQEQIKECIYFDEDIKVKLANKNRDSKGILNTSRENSTYRVVSKKFKNEIPTAIIARLNHTIYTTFNKEKSQYFSGERSIRSYKKDLPIPFTAKSIYDLRYDSELKNFRFSLFNSDLYFIPFKTYLGRDLSNNRVIIERCITGEYKLCDSNIRIEKEKIYLYLCVQQPIPIKQLNPQVKVDAELSFLVPILVTLNDKQYYIGDKGSYIYKRTAIQKSLKRMQQAMKFNKGGKGRVQKMRGIEKLKDKEKNFINSYSHTISHELVKFCLTNNAGKLELKNITQSIEEAKENPSVYRNWSYGCLREKIEYKCRINNIELIIN